MNESVRRQSLPTPSNATEDAAHAALGTLSESVARIVALVTGPAPDVVVLGLDAEELGRATRAVLRVWKVLPMDSAYKRVALEEARASLDQVMEAATQFQTGSEDGVAIELELCDLVRAEAALRVADAIRAARGPRDVRSVARSIGIGIGTLSPLENARGGLPSEETAGKIDAALRTDTAAVVAEARARCGTLKDAHQAHKQGKARRATDLRQRARVRTAVEAVTRDARLAEVVMRMTRLPQDARRTIEKVVADLADAFLAASEARR